MQRLSFSRRRVTVWLAFLAILLNALAPSVSHALAARQTDVRNAPICSASHGASHDAPAPQHAGMLEDCGYCLVHAGSFALAPLAAPLALAPRGHALRPLRAERAVPPFLALIAAPPRGPPALAAI